MPKISIAIPAYVNSSEEIFFLRESFDKIQTQSFSDYEVVVSDNSNNNLVADLCDEYSGKFSIVYEKNLKDIGMSSNSNNAMKMCSSEYIKILHCDDLLFSNQSLEIIVNALDSSDKYWLVNGFNHTYNSIDFFDTKIPKYPDYLLIGNNLLGCPTNVTLRNNELEYYDDNIHMGMDVEWYHRIRMKHGMPIVLKDVLTTSRISNKNATSKINLDIIIETEEGTWRNVQSELDYIKEKHKKFIENWEYPNG
jgi:glycosyltransferase involved in cell wall biosynthesis